MAKKKKENFIHSQRFVGGLVILALVLILSFFYSSTHAQGLPSSSSGLEVSPPTQEVTVDPGKSVDIKAKVTNKSDNEASIKVSINQISSAGEEGQIALSDQT